MGTFALGLATAVIALVALIGLFATFNWLAFVIALYLIIVGLLLALSALKNSTYIATYFGFMRYPFGTGSLMIMTGAMTTGISSAGTIVGSITIAWGVIAVLCHLWLRGHNAAFNVPLTNR